MALVIVELVINIGESVCRESGIVRVFVDFVLLLLRRKWLDGLRAEVDGPINGERNKRNEREGQRE